MVVKVDVKEFLALPIRKTMLFRWHSATGCVWRCTAVAKFTCWNSVRRVLCDVVLGVVNLMNLKLPTLSGPLKAAGRTLRPGRVSTAFL